MKKFTSEEKDRLCEILFYGYFNNKPSETLGDAKFWNCINAICQSYSIDSLMVSRAMRILMAKENQPEGFETWYLFWKMDTSVRNMRGFTGIYWQKQKHFEEMYNAGKCPKITRRITDVAVKRSMYDFVKAIYDIFGSYKYLNLDNLNELFSI
jgi:hypothetical protein